MQKNRLQVVLAFIFLFYSIFFFVTTSSACLGIPEDPCSDGFYAGSCGESSREEEFCCFECEEALNPPTTPPVLPPTSPPVSECKKTREILTYIEDPSIFQCIKRKEGLALPSFDLDCAGLDRLVATVESAQGALVQNKTVSDSDGLDISWLVESAFDLSSCPLPIRPYLHLRSIELIDTRGCFKEIVVRVVTGFVIDFETLAFDLVTQNEAQLECASLVSQTARRLFTSLTQNETHFQDYLSLFTQTLTFTKSSRKVALEELEDRLYHTESGRGISTELTCSNHYPLDFPAKDRELNSSLVLDVGSDCFGGRLSLTYNLIRSLDPSNPRLGVLHTWLPSIDNNNNATCSAIGRLEKRFQFIDREPPVFVLSDGKEIAVCSRENQNEEVAITEQHENLSILPSQALLLPCFSDLSDIKIYSTDNCNNTLKEAKITRRSTIRNGTQVASTLETRPLVNFRTCSDNASMILELEAIDDKGNRAACRLPLLVSNHRSPKLLNPPVRFSRYNCRRHIPHPMPIEAVMPCPTRSKTDSTTFFPFHSQDAIFTSPPSFPNCENRVSLTNHWLIGTGCTPPIDFTQTLEVWDQKGPICINSTLPSIQEEYQCLRDMPSFGSRYNDVLVFMDECDGVPINVKGKQEELLPLATTAQRINRCLDDRQFVNSWSAKDACGNPTILEQLNVIKDTLPPTLKADANRRSLVCSSNTDTKSGTPNYVCFPEFQQQLGKWMIESDNCGGPIHMQIDSVESSLCLSEESTEYCSVALDNSGKPPVLNPDIRRRLPGITIAYLEKKVRHWFYLGNNHDTLCLSLKSGMLHTVNATRGDRCNNNAPFSWSLYNPTKALDDETYDPLDSSTQTICDRHSIISTNTQKETATLSDFGVSYLTIKPTAPWLESLRTQINALLELQ